MLRARVLGLLSGGRKLLLVRSIGLDQDKRSMSSLPTRHDGACIPDMDVR